MEGEVDAFDVASLRVDFESLKCNCFSYSPSKKQSQASVADIYSCSHISRAPAHRSVSDNNDGAFRVAEQLSSTYSSCTDSFDASDMDVPLDLRASRDAANFYSHNIWSSSTALTRDDCEAADTY